MDRILGKDYKRLNKVFEVAQIQYGERPPPAYTHTSKPAIENVTKKKRGGSQLVKKVAKKKIASPSSYEKSGEFDEDLGLNLESQEILSQ